jgi:hypothetical protein
VKPGLGSGQHAKAVRWQRAEQLRSSDEDFLMAAPRLDRAASAAI